MEGGARPKYFNSQMAQSTPAPKSDKSIAIPEELSGINYGNPDQPADEYIDEMYRDLLQPGQRLPPTPDPLTPRKKLAQMYDEASYSDGEELGNRNVIDKENILVDFPPLSRTDPQNLSEGHLVFSTPNAPIQQSDIESEPGSQKGASYAGAISSTSPPDKKPRYTDSYEGPKHQYNKTSHSPNRKAKEGHMRRTSKERGPPPPIPPRNLTGSHTSRLENLNKKIKS